MLKFLLGFAIFLIFLFAFWLIYKAYTLVSGNALLAAVYMIAAVVLIFIGVMIGIHWEPLTDPLYNIRIVIPPLLPFPSEF